MGARVGHVDIAKGISIILVALFHSQLKYFIPEVIDSMSLFRMPLFFLLAGVFFCTTADFDTFVRKKFEVLLKPYFVTSLVIFVAAILLNEEGLASEFLGIFYANGDTLRWVQMWFLPHLFLVYVISYFTFKLTSIHRQKMQYQVVFLLAMIGLGSLSVDAFWYSDARVLGHSLAVPGLPMGLDIVLLSAAFFMLGSFAKPLVINFSPRLMMMAIALVVFSSVVLYSSAHINLNKRVYSDPLLATVGALCGIYLVLSLSFYLNKTEKFKGMLLRFGQASLFILIFHSFIGDKVFVLLLKTGIEGFNVYFAIAAFLVSITAPLGIKAVVVRSKILSALYLPLKNNRKADIYRSRSKLEEVRRISAKI